MNLNYLLPELIALFTPFHASIFKMVLLFRVDTCFAFAFNGPFTIGQILRINHGTNKHTLRVKIIRKKLERDG